jgi:hypothetical protein
MTTYPWGSLDRAFETAVLPVGLYMVRVSADSWIETIKLVKVR